MWQQALRFRYNWATPTAQNPLATEALWLWHRRHRGEDSILTAILTFVCKHERIGGKSVHLVMRSRYEFLILQQKLCCCLISHCLDMFCWSELFLGHLPFSYVVVVVFKKNLVSSYYFYAMFCSFQHFVIYVLSNSPNLCSSHLFRINIDKIKLLPRRS